MASARALTGGTNDVNPQPLKLRITTGTLTSGSNVSNAIGIQVPIQRLSTGGRAQVLEILKFNYDYKITVAATAVVNSTGFQLTLASRSPTTTTPVVNGNADPQVVWQHGIQKQHGVTYPTAGTYLIDAGNVDCTDGAGHGILYGQDNLFLQLVSFSINSTAAVTASEANVCIWYRWKNVGFSEYIGMVTAQ